MWIQPSNGIIKCNWDAAIFKQEGFVGMGMFLGCFASKFDGILSVSEAEAYGLHFTGSHYVGFGFKFILSNLLLMHFILQVR